MASHHIYKEKIEHGKFGHEVEPGLADGEGGEQEEEEPVVEEPQDDGEIDNMPF